MTSKIHYLLLTIIVLCTAACGGKSPEEHIAQAEQFLANADYDAAIIELKNAMQQGGSSARAHWLLGKLYLDLDDAPSAEKELRRAQGKGWDDNDVRPALAQAFLAQGKFPAVQELSHRDLDPAAAANILSAQASAALAEGEPEKAYKLVTRALELQPDSIDAKLAEARILATRGDFTGALIVLEEILTEMPSQRSAWSLKGDILLREQQVPEALAAFDKSIELFENSFTDRLKRALIKLQTGDYEGARVDADFLLKNAPHHAASNYVQGILQFRKEQYPEAITALSLAEPAATQFPMILFYLGSAHLIEGNQDQAGVFANKFYTAAPDNMAGRKLLATIRLQQGRFPEVVELIQPVLDINPDDVGAMNLMANAQLRNGNTDQAISLLVRIAELQPDSPTAQVRLGAGLLMLGEDDAAAQHMETALELNPKFQQADILLVLNHLQQKDFEGAIQAAKAYRRRNPASPTPQNLLGRVYLASDMQPEAREAFQKALTLDPADTAAHHNLAQLAVAAGDTHIARQHYEAILEHSPDSLPALIQLAMLDATEQDDEALAGHLEQAMAAHPAALQPRLMLGRFYLGKNKPDQVAPLFSNLDSAQQQSPEVLQLIALAQLSSNQGGEARYTLEQLIEATPGTPSSHHLLAMSLASSGDIERVRAELMQAVELDPNYLPSLLALARLALVEQAAAQFQQYLDKLIALDPMDPDILRLQAIAAHREDNFTAAIEFASQAYARIPTTQTMLELAAYQKAAGNSAEAFRLQEQWVAQNPQDVASHLALANDLELENKTDRALGFYEKVLQVDADNLVALNNLAWHLRLQDPARALEYIRRASTLAPERPEVLDTLAVIEHLNGENRKALRNIQRALTGAPGNPSMVYHKAVIESALKNDASAIAILEEILAEGAAPFPERAKAEALLKQLKP